MPLKRDDFSREYIFQALIFRGHSLVFRGLHLRITCLFFHKCTSLKKSHLGKQIVYFFPLWYSAHPSWISPGHHPGGMIFGVIWSHPKQPTWKTWGKYHCFRQLDCWFLGVSSWWKFSSQLVLQTDFNYWLFELDDSKPLLGKWLEITKHLLETRCLEVQLSTFCL